MCGIVGYIGHREAYPIVLKGLKRLEYRGYDSTGVAIIQDGSLQVHKKKGKVAELEEAVVGKNMHSNICIGHTRWATHGEPSDRNAHPHLSNNGRLAMLHNGIIENYTQIKTELLSKGYTFKSDTDTEVLLNFIQDIQENNNSNLEEALRIALKRIVGAYCILLIDQEDPETIIAARKGSPLVIGIGKDEHFLASDASPIIEYTKEVVYVNDYEIAIVKKDELILKNLGNEKQTPFIQKLDMELAAIEKGGYDHFMLKEIFEQPATIFDCLRGRLLQEEQQIVMAGVDNHLEAEIGVASTKAFTGQLAVLTMMALKIAKAKGSISDERYEHLINELASVPEKVKTILADTKKIEAIAQQFKGAKDFLYLGRGFNFPIALEGALKLKEITYIHAEGYPAAEMKHGPIALVDENLPVVFVATKDMYYEKVVSNIQEIKARKGQIIAVATEGDTVLPTMSDNIMFVPDIDEVIAPLLSVIPLQLLSYYVGVAKGIDVDKPRNLAKSVTVE